MSRATAKIESAPPLVGGLFSKRDAAHHIAQSKRHIISSKQGEKDPAFLATKEWLDGGTLGLFPWETGKNERQTVITSSSERYKVIEAIAQETLGKRRASLKQKMESVLEELITNAIYHGYRNKDGSEKYSRTEAIDLKATENVFVKYRAEANGIYLSVKDRGGNLTFEEIANTFLRCYNSPTQIDAKEGGAGLGMYMVFESVTHLKIQREAGERTVVSCWIADEKTTDPNIFSFNFFERGSK